HHAHGEGVIHRDMKPENILVSDAGEPYLMDFGLAREVDGQHLTVTGQLLGTPAYMAPEQARGDGAAQGPLTDVYGLGGVLYRALAGDPPSAASTLEATIRRVLDEDPAPIRKKNPSVHLDLET